MKTKSTKDLVSLVLALFMLLMCIPFSMLASDTRAEEASKTYVLEASNRGLFKKGDKTDGQTEKAGDKNYFTLYYSSNSAVDENKKTFEEEDGTTYSSNQRINFGGTMDLVSRRT